MKYQRILPRLCGPVVNGVDFGSAMPGHRDQGFAEYFSVRQANAGMISQM